MIKRLKNLFKFSLTIFGEDPPAGDPPAGTPPAGDPPAGDPPAGAAGDPPAGNKDPFAIFPDEKSFMVRVGREAKKQMATMLQGMGLKDETDLKTMLEAKKAADEAGKTDLEKAIAAQEVLKNERDAAINKTNTFVKNTEIKNAAVAAGIKPERVNYLMKLMDLNSIDVIDGQVDQVLLNAQIKQIVTDIPELIGQGSTLPNKGGSSFNGQNNAPLSYDLIRKMSKEDIAKRLPEINEYMKAHPLK